MNKVVRTAFILISFSKGSRGFLDVVAIVSKFERFLIGSIHVPSQQDEDSVFGILVKADTDQLGAITGSLGKVKGVKVKSAVLPLDDDEMKK